MRTFQNTSCIVSLLVLYLLMSKIVKTLKEMENSPQNVRFSDLSKVCSHYFGEARNKGTSHHVYKTPWQGDPRVNIQKGQNGKAKPYQVKQVLAAVKKFEEEAKAAEAAKLLAAEAKKKAKEKDK